MEKDNKKRNIISKALDKIKIHSAGKKVDYGYDMPVKCSSSSKRTEMIYPTLYLDEKQAPELSGYEVEDEVVLIVKGIISSHSLNESNGKKRENFDIKIKEIGCKKK
ncbi:hypothetical protein KAR91_81140 [Candidatus Pacearchaeota archaeon]|nr:hypothetical protein [Candidatus Pacearchaeota archaeon]